MCGRAPPNIGNCADLGTLHQAVGEVQESGGGCLIVALEVVGGRRRKGSDTMKVAKVWDLPYRAVRGQQSKGLSAASQHHGSNTYSNDYLTPFYRTPQLRKRC